MAHTRCLCLIMINILQLLFNKKNPTTPSTAGFPSRSGDLPSLALLFVKSTFEEYRGTKAVDPQPGPPSFSRLFLGWSGQMLLSILHIETQVLKYAKSRPLFVPPTLANERQDIAGLTFRWGTLNNRH